MSRFLKRILQPFKPGNRKNNKDGERTLSLAASSSLPCSTIDVSSSIVPSLAYLSNSTISSVLTESELYKDGLVHVDALCESSIQGDDQLFCTWNEEFDRIHERSHFALESLTRLVDDLSRDICTVASPLTNSDQRSLQQFQQFIALYLDEWKVTPGQQKSNRRKSQLLEYINNNTVGDEIHPDCPLQSRIDSDALESSLLGLQGRVFSNISMKDMPSELLKCIQQVWQWEHDLLLYQHYMDSQMAILWDQTAALKPTLRQTCLTRWNRRYHYFLDNIQALEKRVKMLLEHNSPSSDDFSCAICLSVLTEPVTLSRCLHTFCRSCLQRLYCNCSTPGCPSSCHRKRGPKYDRTWVIGCHCPSRCFTTRHACPLCRTPFSLRDCRLDIALDNFITLYFPQERPASRRQRSVLRTAVQQFRFSAAPLHSKEKGTFSSLSQQQQQRRQHSTPRRRQTQISSRPRHHPNRPRPSPVHPQTPEAGYQAVTSELYNTARHSWWF